MMKPSSLFASFASLLLFFAILFSVGDVQARVSGPCSDCHTMHNSQNGTAVNASGPYGYLLNDTCVGCHSNDSGSATIVNGTPMVLTAAEPTYPSGILAGGSFYWVAQGNDAMGHNVTDIPGVDTDGNNINNLTPGGTNCALCHDGSGSPLLTGPHTNGGKTYSGCEFCHNVKHHADDSSTVVEEAGGWFRFLNFCSYHPSTYQPDYFVGVEGIEDPAWEQSPSSTNHNEYQGASGSDTSHSISQYCAVCHGNFHDRPGESNDTGGSSPWLRHPTDYAIPNSGEYANAFGATGGTGIYDPQVPVSRPDLSGWTNPSSQVILGTDQVQCLSCHRAHGSPYPDMLRWDYLNDCQAGQANANCGCFVCHTTKDN